MTAAKQKSIGVLDIYGFEIFDVNGFEQFCINYVNERLQQIFIELTLRLEQAEYHEEKMPWKDIEFFNNKVVVDVIDEYPSGIFYCLDDVAMLAGAENTAKADSAFISKVTKNYPDHKYLTMTSSGFRVQHYAGPVQYTCSDFVAKNKDSLKKEITECMQRSTNEFLKSMFTKKKKMSTSATLIRNSATKLMKTLSKCVPYYIRCIKSNDNREPLGWNAGRVKHQVTYLGLAENIKIKKAGYSYRHFYQNFAQRFGPLCQKLTSEKDPNNPGQKIYNLVGPLPPHDRSGAEQVIEAFKKSLMDPKTGKQRVDDLGSPVAPSVFEKGQFGFGTNKIFVKSPETIFMMDDELYRKQNPQEHAEKAQAFKQQLKLANKNRKGNAQGLQPGGCVLL